MPSSFQFDAIGTRWQIDLAEALAPTEEQALFGLVQERIESYDRLFSRFRSDSLLTKISQSAGEYPLPSEGIELVALYEKLYRLTEGAFTPLIGQMLVEAGYDATYSLQAKSLSALPAWDEVLELRDDRLIVKKPFWLDFGAAGKGQLIDLVAKTLREQGGAGYCIDAGGDLLYKGKESLRVGLEHPADPTKVIGVALLNEGGMCGSAGNRRAWGEYHHIFDPKLRASTRDVVATWVIADSATLADALATCLFFVPATTLRAVYAFEHLLIRNDARIERSEHFPANLFV